MRESLTSLGIMVFCAVMLTGACAQLPNPADGSSGPANENVREELRDPESVKRQIEVWGRLRAVQAVPDLIKLLGFRYWYDWEKPVGGMRRIVHPITVGDRYPATSALLEIGKPALPALLEVVETREFNSIESKNVRYTIRGIFRDDPAKADEFFKDAAAKAPSPKASERLLKALDTGQEDMKLSKEDLRR